LTLAGVNVRYWHEADVGNLCTGVLESSPMGALPLGVAFSPAFFKPRLTANIDPP